MRSSTDVSWKMGRLSKKRFWLLNEFFCRLRLKPSACALICGDLAGVGNPRDFGSQNGWSELYFKLRTLIRKDRVRGAGRAGGGVR